MIRAEKRDLNNQLDDLQNFISNMVKTSSQKEFEGLSQELQAESIRKSWKEMQERNSQNQSPVNETSKALSP